MKLPNGYGSVTRLSGKRRKPYMVRKTTGWHYDENKDRQVQDYDTIGYAETKAEYGNYYKHYFKPIMENLGLSHTPHCCRHTCISKQAEAEVNQTMIKKIVGHAGAMTLAEKVYTHLDVKELLNAINKI